MVAAGLFIGHEQILSSSASSGRTAALRLWLCTVAGLIFAMVLVGGATRLTESGLSIVEWKPVTGALPPLSQQAWQAEFEKYQAIPQYQALNKGMSLEGFKAIYWWEWSHRLLGRVIGAAFLLPFLWFLWRGAIPHSLRPRLWGIFALGAFQGAVGWWMVASGLAARISVSQYRLAFHLTLACAIYAAIVWTLRGLTTETPPNVPRRLRWSAATLTGLVFLQIYAGALVAGLDAGLVYNTWPLIDGHFVPAADKLFHLAPAWTNVFENDLTVQFLHRMIGYTLWSAALLHALDAVRTKCDPATRGLAFALFGMLTVQAALGITTLLYVVPIGLALLHQAGAMIVLTLAVVHAGRLAPQRERAAALAPQSRAVSPAG
jgi:cytochrome c oxidase assembly protein subunit 15